MKIFPYLPQFQIKYKGIFGHLLLAMNYYIVYGKQFVENSVENLRMVYDMANLSLYKIDQPVFLSNNAEGAVLLSILLQNLDGELIKKAVPDILTLALSRVKTQPMSKTFQRLLLEIFLSALIQDVNQTL
jgi:hypothetical protein